MNILRNRIFLMASSSSPLGILEALDHQKTAMKPLQSQHCYDTISQENTLNQHRPLKTPLTNHAFEHQIRLPPRHLREVRLMDLERSFSIPVEEAGRLAVLFFVEALSNVQGGCSVCVLCTEKLFMDFSFSRPPKKSTCLKKKVWKVGVTRVRCNKRRSETSKVASAH